MLYKKTIQEKDELTKKLHDGMITSSMDELIVKKVEEFLKNQNH